MPIVRFNSSCYPPRGSRRVAWGGVVVVVVVFVLGFAAGYGEAVIGALTTAVVSSAVTEIIKTRVGYKPHKA